MFGTVEFGEKKIDMLATASTAIRFKQVFHKDLLEYMTGEVDTTEAKYIDLVQEVAFVMAMQAEKKDMNLLSMNEYMDWLDGFDSFELSNKAKEIMDIYQGNTRSDSEPKKKEGLQIVE